MDTTNSRVHEPSTTRSPTSASVSVSGSVTCVPSAMASVTSWVLRTASTTGTPSGIGQSSVWRGSAPSAVQELASGGIQAQEDGMRSRQTKYETPMASTMSVPITGLQAIGRGAAGSGRALMAEQYASAGPLATAAPIPRSQCLPGCARLLPR